MYMVEGPQIPWHKMSKSQQVEMSALKNIFLIPQYVLGATIDGAIPLLQATKASCKLLILDKKKNMWNATQWYPLQSLGSLKHLNKTIKKLL